MDPKSQVFQLCQSRGWEYPSYQITRVGEQSFTGALSHSQTGELVTAETFPNKKAVAQKLSTLFLGTLQNSEGGPATQRPLPHRVGTSAVPAPPSPPLTQPSPLVTEQTPGSRRLSRDRKRWQVRSLILLDLENQFGALKKLQVALTPKTRIYAFASSSSPLLSKVTPSAQLRLKVATSAYRDSADILMILYTQRLLWKYPQASLALVTGDHFVHPLKAELEHLYSCSLEILRV